MTSEVMELPVPNSLDAAAGSVVKSSHEITARGKRRGQNVAGEPLELYRIFKVYLQVEGICMLDISPT